MTRAIEVLARGVQVQDDRILLCRSLTQGHLYLPGGHVESGESIREALEREIEEELGAEVEVGPFLGLLEYSFHDGKEKHAELSVLFAIRGVGALRSREREIEFVWQRLSELNSLPLLPEPLVELLPRWLDDPRAERFASRLDA
ncbi:MAG: NUDIX domain-containing protein [Candidatus Bipolaricaulota bacterium]|nr:NUDIX domain-containing protein [Candidatus Bipolaricaulota bacterium]